MRNVFSNPSLVEKTAKEALGIPDFLMMENAARAIASLILEKAEELKSKYYKTPEVLILCGKGNNGGDGYAVARLLQNKINTVVFALEEAAAPEAVCQKNMCSKLGIEFITLEQVKQLVNKHKENDKCSECSSSNTNSGSRTGLIVLDCLYGTGFHGELKSEAKDLIDLVNLDNAIKIACDIPSALYFKADYTVTMGTQKLSLYSDEAKAACGKIIVADLGISKQQFEAFGKKPDAYLIEAKDIQLPVRNNPSTHKGSFGHTAIFAGSKSGAGIIAATAAMNFGSGLTTLVKTNNSNLEQFKISPELMINSEVPAKTTAVIMGPGLGEFDLKSAIETPESSFSVWTMTSNEPAFVLDADLLSNPQIIYFLEYLHQLPNVKIVLTPHLLELSKFLQALLQSYEEIPVETEFFTTKALTQGENKIKAGKLITSIFPNVTVVMKSANTFIADQGKVYIVNEGCQSLSKGGSGDVLAGMIGSLLAQGYSSLSAAITASQAHAMAAQKIGTTAYDLTPEKLIQQIEKLQLPEQK